VNSCEEYQELISRLADGELSADEEAKLRVHMETCPQCRKLYAAFTAISSAAAEELEAPPEDMKDNIMSAVKSTGGKVVPIRHWKTWLAAAACFALVLAGAAGTGLFGPKGAASTASSPMYQQSDAAVESSSPDVSAETDKTISSNDAISGSDAAGNTAGTPDTADSPEKAVASAPSVPPVVKATAGSASAKAVCVTGPEGGSCVTDADTISKLDAVLKKADLQPVSSSGGYGENLTSAAVPDAYTVEYPDGRTLTVTTDGDAVYCTDASTGETYLASGSAEDFQSVLSQFTGS
jgi:hypothetical protein